MKINHKNFNILTAIFLLICILAYIFFNISGYWFLSLIIIYLSVIFYASFSICSNFYIKVVCKGNKSTNKIALTFDDGPIPFHTEKILNILKKNNISATFFCKGENIVNNPDIAKRIVKENHIIANHSYSHSNFFGFFSTKKVEEEIEKTNTIIYEITGEKVKYFRPPAGITNPSTAKAVENQKLITIGWSLRTLDTVLSKEKTLKRLQKIKGGDIVLFHDTKPKTPEILEDFIRLCNEKKIEIVSLEQLYNDTMI